MTRFRCAAVVVGAILALAAAPAALAQVPAPQAAPSQADSLFRATTLDIAAYGEAKVVPDMATINLGVVSEGTTAAAAMAANSAAMARVLASLKTAGIAAKDIQTSNLNLSPKYVYAQNQEPRLTGYQASNDVRVTVHDLARLGPAVDATVSAGANQVNGISFGLNDRAAAEAQARDEAVRAITAKAQQYARATGLRLVRLVSLSEGANVQGPRPGPIPMVQARMAAQSVVAVSPGELNVRVDVTGLYELAR
ncbi:MAG: SIMPL domain-containing protein [Phenylobacterium sp.]